MTMPKLPIVLNRIDLLHRVATALRRPSRALFCAGHRVDSTKHHEKREREMIVLPSTAQPSST